jgi:hypothetical protein
MCYACGGKELVQQFELSFLPEAREASGSETTRIFLMSRPLPAWPSPS